MYCNHSKRAFQTQFKRWEFPSKQNPAHKNTQLVSRVKELWEKNVSQREMLRILNEEDGFDIKERELMRVRAKNRWLLRVPNGMKSKKPEPAQGGGGGGQNGGMGEGTSVMDQLQQALFEDGSGTPGQDMDGLGMEGSDERAMGRATSPELSPEVLAKRMERLEKLQAESAVRWASRKRRRRTRGWAGLPADPPGPPRFPSETTIDESKAFLSLDNHLYRDIRARFQRICEEADVIKKTIAGPERWEAVKGRLVQESTHLQDVFWNQPENQEQKKLALDVVCTDVTKRMRTLERRMTIAEAKNALGINPEESRVVRNAFYQTLKKDHFTSKLEAGDEHWKELKREWIEGSDLLKRILAPGEADPEHATKVKAMEVLCRDVMKRLRDDQTKRDPTRRKKSDSDLASNSLQPSEHQQPSQQQNQQQSSPQQTHQSQGQQNTSNLPLNPYTSNQPQRHSSDNHIPQYSPHIPQIQPHDALVQAAAHAQAQAEAQQRAHMATHSQLPFAQPSSSYSQTQARQHQHNILMGEDDMRIDPSLLLATANDPSMLSDHNDHNPKHSYDYEVPGLSSGGLGGPAQGSYETQYGTNSSSQIAYTPHSHNQSHNHATQGVSLPLAVYFRLHPNSDVGGPVTSRMWVSTLNSASIGELRDLAVAKYPGTDLVRLEGVVKDTQSSGMGLGVGGGGAPGGQECVLQIDCDEELEAYLQGMGGVKPSFNVQLVEGYEMR